MSSKYETEGVHNIYFLYFYDINLACSLEIDLWEKKFSRST